MSEQLKINNIIQKIDTMKGLISGINAIADVVKTTSGSKGNTYAIRRPDGKIDISKDGVTLAKAIKCDDPIEQMGVTLLQEAAELTVNQAGDGTTGTITMAQQMAHSIIGKLQKNADHRFLLKDVENAIGIFLEELEKEKLQIQSEEECISIATIATNNDEYLGNIIGQVVWAARENGVVVFEESEGTEIEVIQQQGSKYEKPYEWKKLLGKNHIRIAYNNPLVYTFNMDIEHFDQIADCLQESVDVKKPLVIFATDFSKYIINEIHALYDNGMKILPIVIPGYGDEVQEFYHDITALTADNNVHRIIAEKFGFTIYTKDKTQKVFDRTDYIINQIGNETTKYYREQLQKRLSILNQKLYTMYIGAPSETEKKELWYRVEDGLLATRSAYEDGYVLGGGIAFRNVVRRIQDQISKKKIDFTDGIDILADTVLSPFLQIMRNAGIESDSLLCQQATTNFKDYEGVDTNTLEKANFIELGIIDSFRVIKQSLVNASSVIKTIIQLNGSILDNEKTGNVQFVPNQGFKEV